MKIYSFYDGEIHELEVEEKKKTYAFKDKDKHSGMAFEFRKLFYKDENWPTSEKDLIEKEFMKCDSETVALKRKMKKIEEKRKVLGDLYNERL